MEHSLVKFQTAGSEQNNETENIVKLTVVFCNTREHLLMFENVVNCWVHYKVVSCMDQTQTEILWYLTSPVHKGRNQKD